jgi:hypothetical protein
VRSLAAITRAMVSARARRIGRREAEKLLAGDPVSVDRAELVRLLQLAAAPTQPDELAGRRAAVAAFVRAGHYPAAGTAPAWRRPVRSLSRAVAVKVLVGAMVVSVGGVAVAAETGSLPDAVQHGAHELLSPMGVPVPDATGSSSGPGLGAGQASGSPLGSGPGPKASADPGVHGMCEAWQAGQRSGHPKDVDPEVVAALVAAAGGADNIPAFCAAVLAQPAPTSSASPDPHHGPPTPTPTPAKPDKSHGKPSTSSRH